MLISYDLQQSTQRSLMQIYQSTIFVQKFITNFIADELGLSKTNIHVTTQILYTF